MCTVCVPVLTHLYLCIPEYISFILVYNTFVNYMYTHVYTLCIITVYTRLSCMLHSTMHALRILYTVYTVTVFVIVSGSSKIQTLSHDSIKFH